MSLIALLTDFGLTDAYVGIMKGVILNITPRVRIVDITHQVPAHAIGPAALVLKNSYRYFPKGTIFIVVVDPGVGSQRAAIAVKTKNYYFVGPDNGLMYPAASGDGIRKVVLLDDATWHLPGRSRTFHGRDIFAPVAAHLAKGVKIADIRSVRTAMSAFQIPAPCLRKNMLRGVLLYCDRFGNIVTNIDAGSMDAFVKKGNVCATVNGVTIKRVRSFYGQAPDNELFLIEGSCGLYEISMKNRSARHYLKAKPLDIIEVKRCR